MPRKTGEVPQVEYVDNHVHIPVHKHRPEPMVTVAQNHVETSTASNALMASSRLGFVFELDWGQIRQVSRRHSALEEEWLLTDRGDDQESKVRKGGWKNDEEEA